MDNQIFETNQHTGKFSLADFFARIYALVGRGGLQCQRCVAILHG